ncbi:hypothetical protein BKA82DRAFT_4383985 [Pisolithus tinctorius]|nr:hypothetical protein BKA82DRAFT_370121 [Pisolithus tinctorius]KAI6155788.1 hypothetical protein BKA82DRAFT_4383985 [Pisolithus tinctorius]
MSDEGSEVIELSSSVAELNINAVAETGKRSRPITVLSSPEATDRRSFRKKRKDLNANALPTWPCQPAGPISGPVMVKELLSDSDDNTPPNPWSAQFDQTTLLKDDDVSDIDL